MRRAWQRLRGSLLPDSEKSAPGGIRRRTKSPSALTPSARARWKRKRSKKKKCLPHRVKNPKATTLAINPMRAAKGAPKCVGPAATRRVSLLNGDAAVDAILVVAEAAGASKKAEAGLAVASAPSACRFRRS